MYSSSRDTCLYTSHIIVSYRARQVAVCVDAAVVLLIITVI